MATVISGCKSRKTRMGSLASPVAAVPLDQRLPDPLSRYESQKLRDWYTFCDFLRNQNPPVDVSHCNHGQVLKFLQFLDQFGKTKVHLQDCNYFGNPDRAVFCECPIRQAWGSLDALVGRLRAAYEENGGLLETNPFACGSVREYLREIRDSQSKARGIRYKRRKNARKNNNAITGVNSSTVSQMQSPGTNLG